MTDQRLRDLERDAAQGDLQARARLLRERVRVGDLAEERLRLAAYLGDESARAAVGPSTQDAPRDAGHWSHGLRDWPEAAGRVAAAIAFGAATTVAAQPALDRPFVSSVLSASSAVDAWALHPSHQHAQAMRDASRRICFPPPDEDEGEVVWRHRSVVRAVAILTSVSSPKRRFQIVADALEALESTGLETSRTWIAAELIPWALGDGDPLRVRVSARLGSST